jgi:uncharacterized coiled-coil protein SlyX
MGLYNSINKGVRMNKTTNETVQSMQHLDSLKAVKVAMDMNKAQDKTIEKLIDLVASMDKNMKLLATKVLELEKKIKGLEAYANREV